MTMHLPDFVYRQMAVNEIADLIEEMSKDRSEIDDPARRIYAVHRELAAELGRRMYNIRTEQRSKKNAAMPAL